jgi:NADH-quinone oxidoreductase subunit G
LATIYVDGQAYQVNPDQNLLQACLSLGLDLPYFCWHPAMGSVGACRQCAVKLYKDEQDEQGSMVMACMEPVEDGKRISLQDPEAAAFRASVIEWLMVNHPHDCPICDEGGECHLQDMTVMTGHAYRRYRFKKRTYQNQYLGPFINHEMNRCIQCYRCVRFYRDHAGGRDLDVFGAHDHVYFGRHEDGVLQSEFSGNLVEVCPTGVFTDKTLKQHYTRKWDLQMAPSICDLCGLGCNTLPGERYGKLRRVRNRYNRQVNGYFICDRGRYGYEFVNSESRIRQPRSRTEDGHETIPKAQALERIVQAIGDEQGAIGIGSPRASLESNYALMNLVGQDRFYMGIQDEALRLIRSALRIIQEGPARTPSLNEMEQADAVLILGEDVTNSAPMAAYSLRQAVRRQPMRVLPQKGIPEWHDAAAREVIQDEKGPFYIAAISRTKLDDVATRTYRAAPDDLARLGFAVASRIDPQAPKVSDLDDDSAALADEIAEALMEAERPLVLSGVSLGSEALLQAAANVAWALCGRDRPALLSYLVPEGNSLGAAWMAERGLDSAAEALNEGAAKGVIVLENDLFRRGPRDRIEALLGGASFVCALDHLENSTTSAADVALPAATFAEGDGTLVNNEGRAQRYYQVFVPEGEVLESWRWLGEIGAALGEKAGAWENLDEIVRAMCRDLPAFEQVGELAPDADFRIAGMRIPRQPHRYSGRTSNKADENVHEPKPPADPDTPMSFSMEGFQGKPPGELLARYWAPGWNSVQALNKFQSEIAGPLLGGDPGRRLIEPDPEAERHYFEQIPSAFEPKEGELLLLPLHHIFGSEPLSLHTPGVAELAPEPYLAINEREAERRAFNEGAMMRMLSERGGLALPLRVEASLPDGVAAYPAGLQSVAGKLAPGWTALEQEAD